MRASKEARTRERWREQAARLVALACCEFSDPKPKMIGAVGGGAEPGWETVWRRKNGPTREGAAPGRTPAESMAYAIHTAAGGFLDRGRARSSFDVHAVRAYCERLIAEGERLALEREVFKDWTRARGLGPENHGAGAFGDAHCPQCIGGGGFIRGTDGHWYPRAATPGQPHDRGCDACDSTGLARGGWPGPLAREWGTVRCTWCVSDCPVSRRECTICKGRGYVKHPKRHASAANGDSLARTARRLLATLDGRCPWAPSAGKQASECQECDGHGSEPTRPPTTCEACHGTGHNLSGALPAVEWSPALLRKLEDMREGDGLPEASDWVDRLIAAGGEALSSARVAWSERHPQTRVVPRGEHVRSWILVLNRTTTRILPDDDDHAAHVHTWLLRRELPRWRRGELKHSEQRRERARRQAMETIAQSTPYTVEELFEGNDRFRREIADRTHRGSSADADRMLGERAEDLERLAAALDMPVAEVRDHVRAAIVGAPGDVT
jgi:hypothetical protein